MTRFDIYKNEEVHIEGELYLGIVYLHCRVLVRFCKAVYKRFLVIFTTIRDELKKLHKIVRAFVPVADKKLAKFAEIFNLELKQYIKGSNGVLYYMYEV